ncbi:MAG: hypothetical protein Q9201_002840, partial [Fulgogasparrea decipioides]
MPATATATHRADAARIVTAMANAATTAPASTAQRRPAAFTALPAPPEPSVARKVARPKTPNAAAPATTATPAIFVAATINARPRGANAAPTVPCDEEISSSSGGDTSSNGGNDDSGGGVRAPSAPEASPSLSIPNVTIPSFNTSDYPSLPSVTLHSLPAIPTYGDSGAGSAAAAVATLTSFAFPTFTVTASSGAVLYTFSTVITIYYYTIFVTTTTFITSPSSFVTSDYTSTEQTVTALATDSLDAQLVFDTLVLSLDELPTRKVTQSEARDFSETRVVSSASSRRTASSGSQATGAVGFSSEGA